VPEIPINDGTNKLKGNQSDIRDLVKKITMLSLYYLLL
jgi:hypothetical protein